MAPLILLPLLLVAVSAADVSNKCSNGGVWDEKSQRCNCKSGFSGRHCNIDVKCCIIWGDPHYLTFDGAKLNFQGSCKYNLVSRCVCCCLWMKPMATTPAQPNFRVDVKNWRRRNDQAKVSWVRYAEAQINGNMYTLGLNRQVMVNDANVTLPYKRDGVEIMLSGQYARIDTEYGASVQFDGKSRLLVCVPKIWNKLCGICGNNNGDKQDDLRRKDGVDVSGRPGKAGAEIGHSWQVNDPTDSKCTTVEHNPSPMPSKRWERNVMKNEYCGLIVNKDSVFQNCMAHFGNDKINAFFTNCKYDVYETSQNQLLAKEMACESLAALSTECEEVGFPVSGWRAKANCPIKCPSNQKFMSKTSPCKATCADPDAPEKCGRPDNEGCACRDGMVLSGETCVKLTSCGCTDKDGSYHKADGNIVWFSKDCKKRYRCKSPSNGKRPIILENRGCKDDETCKAVKGVITCVKVPVAGGWSRWTKWSECVKFGQEEYEVKVRARTCNNPKPRYGGECEGSVYEVQPCVPQPAEPEPEEMPEM